MGKRSFIPNFDGPRNTWPTIGFLCFQYLAGGVYSTTFDTQLRNDVKISNFGGYIPQLCIMNSEMKDLH